MSVFKCVYLNLLVSSRVIIIQKCAIFVILAKNLHVAL